MSNYTFVSMAYEGYNPGGPTGKWLSWLHDWLVSPDVTTDTTWYCPLYVSRERAEEWHFRFRQLAATFHLSDGTFDFDYTPDLTRKFTDATSVGSEQDLKRPGIIATDAYLTPAVSPTVYSCALNDDGWNGPGSTLDLIIQCDLFRKQNRTVNGSPVDIPHMIWQQDGDLIIPSLVITGSLVATTPGTDLSWFFTSEPISSPVQSASVSVFPSHGGSAIDLNFSAETVPFTSFSLALNPNLFWGFGGKWNTTTGARL